MLQSWSEFFELSKNKPPNRILEAAIKLVVNRDHALDLGAGSLKDSKFMLSMGFKKVTAIDSDPGARKYRSGIPVSQLTIKISPFEGLHLKPNTYNFISAQYALPFTQPPHLPNLMEQIISSLQTYGIFCAQFFGRRDSWNKLGTTMTFFTKSELKKVLSPLNLIYWDEQIKLGKTINGEVKTWHLFEVIAIKPVIKTLKKY